MARLMSPADAVFLTVEKPSNPMHIGGLNLFQPPPGGTAEDVAALFGAGLGTSLTPHAGQPVDEFFTRRAVRSWSTAGQWAWDQGEVDLTQHVRLHKLPDPGQIRQLLQLCSQLHAEPLDRQRPLWQAHLITGLADGRCAVYFKMHHALGDGMTTQRLLRASLSPDAGHRGLAPPWQVGEHTDEPSTASAGRAPDEPAGHANGRSSDSDATRGMSDWLDFARTAAGEAAGFASVLGRTIGAGLHNDGAPISLAAPRSILNPPALSATRRFAAQSWSMQRIRAVREAAGVSTNDVVLAMCAGALRRYLSELTALPDAPLIAMVPVALRDTGLLADSSNAVGAVMCTLATDEADPVERLMRIHRGMNAGKAALSHMSSTQVLAMTALSMSPLLFQPILGRLAGTRPPFNLIISNVPGPRTPLYFNGARLDGIYPLSIPIDGQALNITCTTYVQQLSFGLTGCARTIAHLQRLLTHLETTLVEIEHALLS